jgi:hypothetical protein
VFTLRHTPLGVASPLSCSSLHDSTCATSSSKSQLSRVAIAAVTSRVAKPHMVNRKSRQGGFVGMILKVITLDDQICLFNIALYTSLVRWLTRNAIGICLDLVIQSNPS